MVEIPDWQIERYVLGELPRPEQEDVARAVSEDAVLAARVTGIEESNRQILRAHPPRVAAALIRERSSAEGRPWPRWQQRALVVAASLAVVSAGLAALRPREAGVAVSDETRIKGLRPHLGVFRQTPAGVESLQDGSPAREGDVVQVTYQSAGRRYGVILSVDGRGVVTVHHPREGRQAARLVPGQVVHLQSAYRLDDAPGWERFVLVTAEEPFDLAPVVNAAAGLDGTGAAATARLALPSSFEQSWFALRKEARR
jgi:hypothetical protein